MRGDQRKVISGGSCLIEAPVCEPASVEGLAFRTDPVDLQLGRLLEHCKAVAQSTSAVSTTTAHCSPSGVLYISGPLGMVADRNSGPPVQQEAISNASQSPVLTPSDLKSRPSTVATDPSGGRGPSDEVVPNKTRNLMLSSVAA